MKAEKQRITKKAVVEYLRAFELLLHSEDVVGEVSKLPFDQKMTFFSARLTLGNLIIRLNSSLMRDIGDDLRDQADSLKDGIDSLSNSLGKLEDATRWAKAVAGITTTIGKVVKVL